MLVEIRAVCREIFVLFFGISDAGVEVDDPDFFEFVLKRGVKRAAEPATAGAPVDIIVNGNLIAKGDIVVIDDNFAVRITEIIKSKLMDSINKE